MQSPAFEASLARSRSPRESGARIRFALIALASVLALSSRGRGQDAIVLTDGKTLEGRVIYEDARKLILWADAHERPIQLAEVRSVRSVARSSSQVLDQWMRLTQMGPGPCLDLARFCKTSGLPGDAEVFAWDAVLAELDGKGECPAAHELLGHTKREQGWCARTKLGWTPVSELALKTSSWDAAWELPTLHYKLRTNLPLRQALGVALDLELTYRAFFQTFGADLDLREVLEPMSANVHADSESYPNIGAGRLGFFHTRENLLSIDASRGLDVGLLIHEATHQLVYNTAVLSANARGEIPGWLDEGLAEYVRAAASGSPGRARFTMGRVDYAHFRTHARANKPYDLSRVLTFSVGDFMASSHSDLKYAQSYTLIHFALNADAGRWRTGFIGYLRRAYAGQASSSAFCDSLGASEIDIERGWQRYVLSIAAL
jgi:hypothetical protein